MADTIHEIKNSGEVPGISKEGAGNLQVNVWSEKNLADFKAGNPSGSNIAVGDLTITGGADGKKAQVAIHELTDLQAQLDRTQKMIQDLTKTFDTGVSNFESSARSLTGNPYKLLLAGGGIGLMSKSPWATASLGGLAALQGYDDIKMLSRHDNLLGRSKYTLGLLADGSAIAGAVGYLTDAIPMKYRAPLLFGGLAIRAAVDFIPDRKKN